MSSPLVSVLLPCFNDGAWIDDAIASVMAQTYRHFEIVVVDDGSTDPATRATLEALEGPQIRRVQSGNRGLPAARNLAASRAAGELFCALDADDRLAPTWFEKAVALLDARPDLAFVSHWLETFGDEHWAWAPRACDLPALLARNTVNGAALVRRAAFEAVGGYEESMREGCEDWDFWLRLVERGFRGEIIPEVLFFYRRRPQSMSRVMTGQEAYRRPLADLVRRHEASYRAHLIDVVIAKEAEAMALARETNRLERSSSEELQPALGRAREELAAAEARVERAKGPVAVREERDRLRWEAGALRREVADLRGSWSWRLTAPLRWLYRQISGAGQ